MNYFRFSNSTSLDEVGTFPQTQKYIGELAIDAPNHLFTQEIFEKYPLDLFIPKVCLRANAKLTDNLSFQIKTDFIISKKLKELLVDEGIQDVEFPEINIIHHKKDYQYFLLHFVKPKYECLDFNLTDIHIMATTWDTEYTLRVKNPDEFYKLISETKLPQSIKIRRPYFVESCAENMFALRYAYYGFQFFVSDKIKILLEARGITGIQYKDLDEL